jgi:hypothetical protein
MAEWVITLTAVEDQWSPEIQHFQLTALLNYKQHFTPCR